MEAVLADAHTHLDQYPPDDVPGILQRSREAGVTLVIAAGVTEESSAECIAMSNRYDIVYAGVGIHPMQVKGYVDHGTYGRLLALARSSPRVVCISEVGLDFAEGMPDINVQHQALREQVRLARELGLPVIFHSRVSPDRPEDHYETLRILGEEQVWEIGGAMHYFQWDERLARKCIDLNLLISLGKPLLRLENLQEVVRRLPLENIVLETDAYPQYFKRNRMQWTEPKDVRAIAEKLAELKKLTTQEVAEATTANLLRLLKGRADVQTRP